MARPSTPWFIVMLLVAVMALVASCGGVLAPPGTPGQGGPRRFSTPRGNQPGQAAVATLTPTVAARVATPASPRSVVAVFNDTKGRPITLFYGRAVGRRGDWGWSHIIGKHLKGEWFDGGPITNFSVIGVTTPDQVQEIIKRSLQDTQPDPSSNGRSEYRLRIDERYEMLTVVGSDGAIITAYPDSPRRAR